MKPFGQLLADLILRLNKHLSKRTKESLDFVYNSLKGKAIPITGLNKP
jgi:hypothetical protein